MVACDEDVQLRRLMQIRNLSEAMARERIAAQPPFAQKQRLLSESPIPLKVIHNNGSLEVLEADVEQHWRHFLSVELHEAETLATEISETPTAAAV